MPRKQVFVKIYSEHQGKKHYRDDLTLCTSTSFGVEKILGTYCHKVLVTHREPAEMRSRIYKTPHLVYDIEIMPRTSLTESEFLELEATTKYSLSTGDEIWKVYTRFDNNTHSEEEIIVTEWVDHFGTFFCCDYRDSLERLINIHVWNGWRRSEVIASIHKLLNLKSKELEFWQVEKLQHLRQLVEQNPELLQQYPQAS